jgi:hypothetical protein
MTSPDSQFSPRSGDGSLPAEDDAQLRQPEDTAVDDPDTEPADDDIDLNDRTPRPSQPAEGPDDPAYTG